MAFHKKRLSRHPISRGRSRRSGRRRWLRCQPLENRTLLAADMATYSVGDVSGAPGSQVTVPINLDDGSDNLPPGNPVQAIEAVVTYDPTMLTVDSASAGPLLTTNGQSWLAATNLNYNGSGNTLVLGAVSSAGLSGDFTGTAFSIVFTINAGATGTTNVDVAASTADGQKTTSATLEDNTSLTLTPAPTNDAGDPVFGTVSVAAITNAAGQTFTATEGKQFSGEVAGFSDAGATSGDFTASIDWGDTQSSPGTVTTAAGGGFIVNGAHTYAEERTRSVTVTIIDSNNHTAVATGTAEIGDAPLAGVTTAAATGGVESVSAAALTGATFSDANTLSTASDFSVASVDWGDGNHDAAGLTVTGSVGSYTLAGSHIYAEEGPYSFSITVQDVGGSKATITGSTNVADAPLTGATTASAGGGVEGKAPATLSGATFTDADSGAPLSDFTISAVNWGDNQSSTAGLSISGSGGNYTVSGAHLYAEEGIHRFSVTVKDVGGSTATITGSANVADAPLTGGTLAAATGGVEGVTAAALTGATFTDAYSGASLSDFSVVAVDWGDGNAGTTGLSVTGGAGDYTVTGSHLYAEEGSYNFSITVKDVGGSTATITGSANVVDTPLAGATAAAATGGVESVTAAALSGATFTDANRGAPLSDFSVIAVNWGDGSADATGLSVTGGAGNFTVAGSHLYAEDGAYNISITVKDAGGSTATITAGANVADAPLTGAPVTIFPVAGVAFSGAVAKFTDANPTGGMNDFSAIINWGDGGSSPGTISEANGTFSVSGQHVFGSGSHSTILVAISDSGGSTTTVTSQASPRLTGSTAASATAGVEGVTPATLTDATFSDADTLSMAADFTIPAVDWGDGGGNPAGLSVTGNSGHFTVSGSHLYAEEGLHNFSITVEDADGDAATITGSANVADAPLTGTNTASAIAGVESVTPATLAGATFTDANTGAAATDFSITAVNWGDGGADVAGLSLTGSGGHFTVGGSHLYAEDGVYDFSITVKDAGGNTVTLTGSANVADAPISATGVNVSTTEGATLNGTIATFTDADKLAPRSDYSATIDWGDSSSPTTVSGSNMTVSGGTLAVAAGHLYALTGNYPIQVTLRDLGGSTMTATATAIVAPAATIASGETLSGTQATAFSTTVATFTHGDGSLPVADFKAAIDWGDGTLSAGTIAEGGGSYRVTGHHTYAQPGTFTIATTISEGGVSTVATGSAVVSPQGTFGLAEDIYVIGSGTINVPAANGLLANDSGRGQLMVSAETVPGAEGGTFTFHADGSFTYTPPSAFPGFDYAKYSAQDAAGDQGTATVNILSQAGGVIWKFYEQVLDRDPDYQGLQGWIDDFLQGGTPGDIAAGFFESTELLNQLITRFYQQYLGRAPLGDDLDFWGRAWRVNGGPELIKAQFASSVEFNNLAEKQYGAFPDGWLTALYERILGRAPQGNDLPFWEKQLAGGTTEGQVTLDFFTSPEAFGNDVAGWFEEYLGRAPTSDERSQYANQMLAGASDRDIEQAITNLPEYAANPPAAADGTGVRLPDYLPQAAGANSQAAIAASDAVFKDY